MTGRDKNIPPLRPPIVIVKVKIPLTPPRGLVFKPGEFHDLYIKTLGMHFRLAEFIVERLSTSINDLMVQSIRVDRMECLAGLGDIAVPLSILHRNTSLSMPTITGETSSYIRIKNVGTKTATLQMRVEGITAR